jgi:hypothetical protein
MYEAQGLLNVMNNHCELTPEASGVISQGPIGWGCVQEYVGIFPLLDWTALNGATALVDLPMPPCGQTPQCCWHSGVSAGNKSFVGGVSDDTYGATVMDTSYLTLTAKKATFFFDNAIISMGVNISESSGKTRVRTALASRFLKKDSPGLSLGFTNGSVVTINNNISFSIPSGTMGSSGALAFAYADFVGWIPSLPVNGNQNVDNYPQVDGWVGYINKAWSDIGVYPGNVSGRTISLTIQHDNGPSATTTTEIQNSRHESSAPLFGASFAYAILPDSSFNATKAASLNLYSVTGIDLAGLINSNTLQAAVQITSDKAVLQAVFWTSGVLVYNGGEKWIRGGNVTLTVNHASLILATINATSGDVSIGASNPDTPDLNLTVGLSVIDSNGGKSSCSEQVFSLNPSANPNFLGQSQVQTCTLVSY